MRDLANKVYYSEMDSPIGPLTIATTGKGVCWLEFGKLDDNMFILKRWVKRWINSDQLFEAGSELDDVKQQLTEYFAKQRYEFDLQVDLYGTPFQKLVWNSLMDIPYGETRSYKDIAIKINAPKAVRAIGGANNSNPVSIIVPCHRVIGSNGNLVGYGGGLNIKQFLLELEDSKTGVKNIL